jgi:AbiV family abortive infection protein
MLNPKGIQVKKKLNAYRGRLSAAQVAAGMNAAAKNASRLAKDAAMLLDASSFPTAASIAILSIEEAGKVSILRTLALAKSDVEAAETWKDYRSHTRKNAAWLLPQLAAAGARKLDDLRPLFDETSDHPFVLDQLKQLGFYTDCLGNAHWAMPSDVIEELLTRMIVQIAQLFARDREYTEREVQLWIEHVGPVWKKNPAWMKQAVVNWYAAMQEAGLVPEGVNEMEQFIHHGLQAKGV